MSRRRNRHTHKVTDENPIISRRHEETFHSKSKIFPYLPFVVENLCKRSLFTAKENVDWVENWGLTQKARDVWTSQKVSAHYVRFP